MKIKRLQDDQNRNVLLVIHDETGQAHDLIEQIISQLLQPQEPEDDPRRIDRSSTSSQD